MVLHPAKNLHHRRPRLEAFVFGVHVVLGVLPSAPGNAPAVCQLSVDVVEIVSCFRLGEGAGTMESHHFASGKV